MLSKKESWNLEEYRRKTLGAGLKAKRAFQDSMRKSVSDYDEDIEIYKDPNDGSYYFIDFDTGEEIETL